MYLSPMQLIGLSIKLKLNPNTAVKETSRINGYIFAEHLIGQIFALIIGTVGIVAGSWVAINGQPWAGGTIATAAIGGLAVVFLTGRKAPQ